MDAKNLEDTFSPCQEHAAGKDNIQKPSSKTAVLLVNLGTPRSTKIRDLRSFLKEFLLDQRVLDIPFILRQILVKGLILPFRPYKIASAYQKIWSKQGSPLMVTSLKAQELLQKTLGPQFDVQLAMRYADRPIAEFIKRFINDGHHSIIVIPLFPQYSTAATGSVIAKCYEIANSYFSPPSLKIIRSFFDHRLFIKSQANLIAKAIEENGSELLITSYHGVPVRHLTKSGCQNAQDCQKSSCPIFENKQGDCYRLQCFKTTDLLKKELDLNIPTIVAFQSRLGKIPWIKPYLDEELERIAPSYQGKNITVACPSFTADCLETLEEIGDEAAQTWHDLTGGRLNLAPCVNTDASFIECLADICRQS